jgi:hypothetical protein
MSFEKLMADQEAEVRTAAAGNVTAVARAMPRELVSEDHRGGVGGRPPD